MNQSTKKAHSNISDFLTEESNYTDYWGMLDFLTKDEKELFFINQAFIEETIRPLANKAWETATTPRELFPLYGNHWKTHFPFETRHLKLNAPVFRGLITMDQQRVDASLHIAWGVSIGLCLLTIDHLGSDAQKETWLEALYYGEKVGCWALTEPENSSDISLGMTTTAQKKGNQWILNGEKKWIGNATFADITIVMAKDCDDNQVKAFIVDTKTPGYCAKKLEGKISARGVENALVTLKDCVVDESNRLPKVNSFRDISKFLASIRAGIGWGAAGTALGCYEKTLEYCKHRMQFGKAIGNYQLIQKNLVEMCGLVCAMQSMCLRMSLKEAKGERVSHGQSSLLKAFCSQKTREVVSLGRDCLGGNGILLDYEVGRYFADAEVHHTYEGSYGMNLLITGKEITGLSAFI